MMREVSLETLSNVNIRDASHDKNLPIMSVTGSINQNVFKLSILMITKLSHFTIAEMFQKKSELV